MESTAPFPAPHRHMESTVLKNVLVLVHHVTMRMDATQEKVDKHTFILYFGNLFVFSCHINKCIEVIHVHTASCSLI